MKNLISGPLFKENLKRFWGFGAVVFIAYFLTTNFILLVEHDRNLEGEITSMIKMSFPTYWMFGVIFPIVSAVIMFSYLAKVNSTTAMHTLPFSRKSLFVTNYLSGLVLCLVPVIINFVIMIGIKRPVLIAGVDIYTTMNVLKIMLSNAVAIFFVYSVSILAGMFCGNSIIHLLTAFAMNFIIPLLYLTTLVWSFIYLYGFVETNSIWSTIFKMHPVLLAGDGVKTFSITQCLIFTGIAIALSILAFIFYKKRSLERAGDSYVFGFIKYIIAFIFTYVPATGMAMLLSEIAGGRILTGLIIGGVVGFIIGWMIINKNFKIFNLKGLAVMLCCFGLTALILLGFKFDFIGFEKRIPNEKDIVSINYDCEYIGNNYLSQEITDKDNIIRLRNIHELIIENKDFVVDEETGYGTTWFNINYNLKNGSTLRRYYSMIPVELIDESNDLKDIFESNEVAKSADEIFSFKPNDCYIHIDSAIFYNGTYSVGFFESKDPESLEIKAELINALAKDLKDRSFEEAVSHKIPIGNITISMEVPKEEFDTFKSYHYINYYSSYDANNKETFVVETYLGFNFDYENVISVLEKYNLLESLLPSEDVGFMVIGKNVIDNENYYLFDFKEIDDLKLKVDSEAKKNNDVAIFDTELQRDILLKSPASNYTYNKIKPENRVWLSIFGYCYDYNESGAKFRNGYLESIYSTYVDLSTLPESIKSQIK